MKMSSFLCLRVVFGVLATTIVLLAMGCSGGWGDLKPAIAAQQGQAQTVVAGHGVSFSIAATGTGPFTYQWYLNGVAITGATSSSYTITATTSSQNGAVYTVAVTNAGGTTMSAPYVLTVNTPPVITTQPVAQTVLVGQTATFTAAASGTAPLTYQWYQGSTPVAGATAASFTAPVTTSIGSTAYSLIVTNMAGTAASATAALTVMPITPTLSFAPIANQTYGSAAFAVSATSASSGAVSYSVASGPASIANNTVTLTGAGTVVLTATQAASGNYATATASTSFSVGAETPILAFSPIANQAYGSAAFAVSATSASSGAVSYSVASGPASIANNTVTLTGAGTVVLTATQAAIGNYATATASTSFSVSNSIPVASNLTGSSASPTLGASINLVPTFSGGTAVIGSAGPGSSNVAASVVSGASYPTAAVTAATTYTLTVTGTGGNSVSTSFTATPQNVSILAVTPAQTTAEPGPQTFSAQAIGGATNALTWSASGGTITSSGVWTSPDTPGIYTITATSVDEPSVSRSTTITVSAPVFLQQPISKNVCVGANTSLSISSNYVDSDQWYKNGSPISFYGQVVAFQAVTTANAGVYTCTLTNAAGSVTSSPATLNVVQPTTLTITQQPASVSVYATQTATFSVAASGTGTLKYQWLANSGTGAEVIVGATSNTYTTPALTASDNGTTYSVTVTDPDCTGSTVASTAATLSVSATDTAVPPTIVTQPTGQISTVNGSLTTFSVTASGPGTLTYQWYRVPYSSTELTSPTAGTAIPGATSTTYAVPSTATAQSNDGDTYYVVVINSYGSAMSNRVVLAVGPGIVLQITGQPQTAYVTAGTVGSFSVTATCTGCIPAYQWYWYSPNSTTATALTDGAVSTGALNGATVAGSASSSLTLDNLPASASTGVFYAVVTSTSISDGVTPSPGANPLTTSTAGLFVGSLGSIGNTATAGDGLCNMSGTDWVLQGNSPGTTHGSIPYQNTTQCTIEMTDDNGNEHAAVYWPTLISTANFSVSFTVAMTATGTPADGFAMVLANPSQGATTSSIGTLGEGLGANGIPGFVLGFDTYQNGDGQNDAGCLYDNDGINVPCDPVPVPYMAVGQGATSLWENPWTFVNGKLDTQNSTDYTASSFANSTHSYVVTVVNGIMTVTMDGNELFTGTVSLPPVAYLGFTASTGGSMEAVTFSNLTATVSAP